MSKNIYLLVIVMYRENSCNLIGGLELQIATNHLCFENVKDQCRVAAIHVSKMLILESHFS
jgi:hypothetical protein